MYLLVPEYIGDVFLSTFTLISSIISSLQRSLSRPHTFVPKRDKSQKKNVYPSTMDWHIHTGGLIPMNFNTD